MDLFFPGSGCYETFGPFSAFQQIIFRHHKPYHSPHFKQYQTEEKNILGVDGFQPEGVIYAGIYTKAVFLNFTIHNNILYEFGVIDIIPFPTMSQTRILSKALQMQMENFKIYAEI